MSRTSADVSVSAAFLDHLRSTNRFKSEPERICEFTSLEKPTAISSQEMPRYQDIYPSSALFRSVDRARASASDLLTLEYFEAEPASMPIDVFDQHHVLLNLRDKPLRVENWRDGEHRDFIYLPGPTPN